MPRSLLAALVCLAAAGPCWAAELPSPPRRALAAFNRLDSGDNGAIDLATFLRARPLAGQVFAVLDRNGDGVLDRKEFLDHQGAARAGEFRRLDRAHNGKVTLAEFEKGWNADLFAALSGGRGWLTPGDLWPGLSTAVTLPASTMPEPAATEAPPAASPCWIPLTKGRHEWGVIAPFSCPRS
jgi:hypothetical protein